MEYFCDGHTLQVGKQLGCGAEGTVFEVDNNHLICMKIFHENKRQIKRLKIDHMLHRPIPEESCFTIAWPLASVYNEQQEWVGFVMPFVSSSTMSLYELTLSQMNTLDVAMQSKFDSSQTEILLKIATNLSIAVAKLHSAGVIIGDLKPQNVLVSIDGRVHLLDTDSMQIGSSFQNDARSPDYSPKEHLQKMKELTTSWDCFALSVIIYEILCRIHPFLASFVDPYEDVTLPQDAIDNDLLVIAKATEQYIYRRHELHDRFQMLPLEVQDLLLRGLSGTALVRPTAQEFAITLTRVIRNISAPTPAAPILKKKI
ncbi:protein kinase [uncultured Tolumonas sp.]|uniref:protein kinase domain-containing protein n=1 Tax=uncultured Tolumonas sp. TaxID=263765 RepID=UPI002A0A8663|nr:protein kinase [uncultured Tolumonas sp.]